MKKYFSQHLITIGIICIVTALTIATIRSYTIDAFMAPVNHDFMAPAGQMMEPETQEFSFAAASDTGSRNEPIERIIKKVRKSKDKFIIHLGDLVQYHIPSHFNWISSEVAIKLKNFPFYAIPGNHELSKTPGEDKKALYKKTFGPTYYWFSYGNTLFVALDSSEEKFDNQQLLWLDGTLNKLRSQFAYCVIYSHVPPIDPQGSKSHKLDDASAQKFASIIKKHNISLLLFGHVHYFFEGEFAGVPMYTLPSSGQPIRGDVKKYGYIEIKISQNGVEKVKPRYIDSGRDREDFDIFMNSVVVRSEVRWFSVGLLILGFILTASGLILKKYYKK